MDTLSITQTLQDSGLARAPAEVIAKTIKQEVKTRQTDLVTKSDLKVETTAIRSDINNLENKIKDTEIKLVKWMIGINATMLFLLIAPFRLFKF